MVLFLALAVACVGRHQAPSGATASPDAGPPQGVPPQVNSIEAENAQVGAPNWRLNKSAGHGEIEAYALVQSAAPGGAVPACTLG